MEINNTRLCKKNKTQNVFVVAVVVAAAADHLFLMSVLTPSTTFIGNEAKHKTKHRTLHCCPPAVIDDSINPLSAQPDHVSSDCTDSVSLL